MSERWLCYECARRCDPAQPSEWAVIKSGYTTIALHHRCVESYKTKSDRSYHVPLNYADIAREMDAKETVGDKLRRQNEMNARLRLATASIRRGVRQRVLGWFRDVTEACFDW